ncbi:ribosome-associated complex subunit Ssz1p [[Candida] anglica]|uniref:Ribosome-associated complex subunit Ssz1p n=1 Tax=[Candida] anglica TaxID=148631 RepID=A0ABP0EGR2_9ASCO
MSSVIGIAFGNTSSSIAVANQDGKVEVIANPDGDRSIPSVLSYVGEDEYHGAQAKAQLIRNPQNTITNFRDHIGKKFVEIVADEANVAAPVVEVAGGLPGYKVNNETISVEEATKRHLKQIKIAAEDYIGKSIEGVVMTVPTDFTATQKTELARISGEAGLKVVQLINEPSAALLAHLSAEPEKLLQDKVYVVADFGGVRSDAAVISVRGGIFTILATAHEHGLGGDQLDASLSEYFAKEFEKKYKANPRTTARSLAKLKQESIVVKKTLSNVQTSTCSIESLADGFDFHTTINRLRFELTAKSVLSQMTAFVEKVVTKAGLENLDIDEVLLVGGSSHTPKLASNVSFVFPESTVVVAPALSTKALDPAELVCRGAALQGSLVEAFDEEEIHESLQPVVVNTQHLKHSIGIKDAEGNFQSILVAETAYPIKKSIEVTNGESSSVVVELYEGKRTIKETVLEAEPNSDSEDDYSDDEPEIKKEVVYECGQLLGELALKDLKPNSKLEVIVNITQNGTLHVSGRELKQGSIAVKGEITA